MEAKPSAEPFERGRERGRRCRNNLHRGPAVAIEIPLHASESLTCGPGCLTLQGSPTTIRVVPFTEKARAGASKIWLQLAGWPDAPEAFVLGRMIRRIP